MFKGIIIENKKFYRLKKYSSWISTFFIFSVLLLNHTISKTLFENSIEKWRYEYVYISAILFTLFLSFKLTSKQKKLIGQHRIEIDEHLIKIFNVQTKTEEKIEFNQVEKICVRQKYFMDAGNEFQVNKDKEPHSNFISIIREGKLKTYLFQIDSYYMANQINKLIPLWKNHGYSVETIS